MLPEGRWTHVRPIRQVIPLQRLTELRAVRTGQQAETRRIWQTVLRVILLHWRHAHWRPRFRIDG